MGIGQIAFYILLVLFLVVAVIAIKITLDESKEINNQEDNEDEVDPRRRVRNQ